MPFRSQAQWNWAFATDQEFADEWAKLTPGGKRRYELLRRRVEKKQSLKHLPGKHDQRKHGRDGGGGSGGGSASTKPLSELSTDELITLLDDPSQYNSEAYAVSKAGVDLVREYLKNDELAQQFVRDIGLDMNDPDTPSIVAGLFSIVKNPLPNQSVSLRSNGLDGYSRYVSKEENWQTISETNKGIENYATFTIDDSILNITNNTFFNSSDIRGMGYTVRRQQILAAQLYKQKTGRDVRINATAVSNKNYSLNGAHTWPFVGYNFVFNDAFSGHMKSYGFNAGDSYSLFKQRNSDGKTGAEMYRTMLDDWILPGEEFSIHGRLYATEPQGLDGLEILVGYGRKKYGSKTKAYIGNVNMNNSDLDDTDIAILIDLWNAKVPPKKQTRREKALVRYKHLPGRHNQQSHGRRGGAGGGGGGVGGSSASIEKFNDWNQREIDRIERTMQRVNDWVKRVDKPNYSDDEREQLRSAFQKALGTQSGESDLQFVRFLRDAKRLGLTVEEAQTIIRNRDIMKSFRKGVVNISEETVSKALLSDHYNEQRIRISRMDKDTQQQMLDEITSKPKSERTQWDYDRAAALTIYADPEVRWNSMRFMADNYSDANRNRVLAGKTIFDGRDDVGSPYKTMQFYSLDYRLYNVLDQAGLANVPYSQIIGSGDAIFDNFMQTFSYTHTSQSTDNVLGAQIQYAVSQVGANANAPRPPSFFPRGVNTPTSNPEVQRLLNMQYEATQQRLAGSKPLDLYRGQNADFSLGIPMSPWSDQKRVSIGFAMQHSEGKRILNSARVSNQYIFMDHNDPNWRSNFYGEREYLVQETAFVYRSKKQQMGEVYDKQTGNRYEDVTWTEKAIMAQIPEPNSYLEDQYDIFYNYRVKPKRTRREKAVARMKADFEARGNTPGRRWSAGAGEVISGDLARDDAGRFASASGGGRARRAVEVTNQILERQGGAKPKKKKPTKAPRDVEQERRDSEAKRRAAGEEGMEAVGFKKEDFAFVDSNEAKDPNDKTVQRLIADGLMEEVNGKAYPTAYGRRLAKAVARGEYGTAQEIVDRYEDKKKRSEESTKEEGFSPPSGVRSAARRGLALRSEFGRGGTAIGVARARDLSNGKSIPLKTIKRMVSFFARHAVDKRPNWSDPSNPTNGYIAHLLWGGDAGRSWANSIAKRMEGKE